MDEQPEEIPKDTTKAELRRWLTTTRAMLLEARRAREPAPAPELGTVTIAGMEAKIVSVVFRENQMHVIARLPEDVVGPVGGRWMITGTDGTVCYRSRAASPDGYFGTKTACLAVWELDFGANLKPDGGWGTDEQARARWPG